MFIQKLIHKNEKASGIIKFHHQLEQLKNIFSLATDMTAAKLCENLYSTASKFDYHVNYMIKA